MKIRVALPVKIFEDNQAAIAFTKDPVHHSRAKHIEIKYLFTREMVLEGVVEVVHCPTRNMIADILTKGVGAETQQRLRSLGGLRALTGEWE